MTVTLTFVARGLRHTVRNADALVTSLVLPVVILLMFVYVFGTAIDVGVAGVSYVDFVLPSVVLLCAGHGAAGTAVGVAQDKEGGVLDRVRSLPVPASAVLTGHVVASLVRNLASTVLVVAVGLAVGFRSDASGVEWLAAAGLVTLFILAFTWIAVALGMAAGSVEGAAAFGFVALFLPYVSSAFVPTDGLPGTLRWLADHQPVTPLVDTLRGLLSGSPIGSAAAWSVAWCLVLLVPAVAWASWQFRQGDR